MCLPYPLPVLPYLTLAYLTLAYLSLPQLTLAYMRFSTQNDPFLDPENVLKTIWDSEKVPKSTQKAPQKTPKIHPETRQNQSQNGTSKKSVFGPRKAPQESPKGTPKGTQNQTQKVPKSITNLSMEKVALQERLGGVLERSWVVLGDVLRSQSAFSLQWRSKFQKTTFSEKNGPKSHLGAIWEQLGVKKAPQKPPKRTPKTHQKNDQKNDAILEQKKPPREIRQAMLKPV